MVTDALIIDHEVRALAPAESDNTIAWHTNHLDILSLRHAKDFQNEVRDVLRTINLKYFVLLAVKINLVRVLGIAELARADLVDGREGLLLVIIKATTSQPFLQAL